MERMSEAAGSLGIQVSSIFHSGKTRARQTAEILAGHLNPGGGCMPVGGLGPTDDPETACRLVVQSRTPVMLVGHLPHLGRLASLLITGVSTTAVMTFHNAGLVCTLARHTVAGAPLAGAAHSRGKAHAVTRPHVPRRAGHTL